MTEPDDIDLSVTATEALTVLVVGVAVACTAYAVGRARRFLNRLDPTSDFRHRMRDARTEYKEVREAWLHIGLFGPMATRVTKTRASYTARREAFGEISHNLRGAMSEISSMRGGSARPR